MVTTDIALRSRRALPPALRPYLYGYGLLWASILFVAAVVALIPAVRHGLQYVIPIDFKVPPRRQHPAVFATAFRFWFDNARLMLGPLALAMAVMHATQASASAGRLLRRVGDTLLAAFAVINLLPFAVTLGTWGTRSLPYNPHAPLEMAAFSTALVTWWLATRRRLPTSALPLVAVVIVVLLAAAAAAETWLIP